MLAALSATSEPCDLFAGVHTLPFAQEPPPGTSDWLWHLYDAHWRGGSPWIASPPPPLPAPGMLDDLDPLLPAVDFTAIHVTGNASSVADGGSRSSQPAIAAPRATVAAEPSDASTTRTRGKSQYTASDDDALSVITLDAPLSPGSTPSMDVYTSLELPHEPAPHARKRHVRRPQQASTASDTEVGHSDASEPPRRPPGGPALLAVPVPPALAGQRRRRSLSTAAVPVPPATRRSRPAAMPRQRPPTFRPTPSQITISVPLPPKPATEASHGPLHAVRVAPPALPQVQLHAHTGMYSAPVPFYHAAPAPVMHVPRVASHVPQFKLASAGLYHVRQ